MGGWERADSLVVMSDIAWLREIQFRIFTRNEAIAEQTTVRIEHDYREYRARYHLPQKGGKLSKFQMNDSLTVIHLISDINSTHKSNIIGRLRFNKLTYRFK